MLLAPQDEEGCERRLLALVLGQPVMGIYEVPCDHEGWMKRLEAPLLRIKLELPNQAASVPLCRRTLRFLLAELAVGERRADDIELAISEATSNVVQHAYPGPGRYYQVTIEFLPDTLRLRIEDNGIGFLPALPEPELEEPGGRGLWLIQQLADGVTLDTLPGGGCRLVADFALPAPPRLMM